MTYAKPLFWIIAIIAIAILALLFIPPMIDTLKAIAPADHSPVVLTNHELYPQLRDQYLNAKILDPYDPRWWKQFPRKDVDRIEKALNDFFDDTEYDGVADALLLEALRQAGVNVSSLEDAVHAANHIVNSGPNPKSTEGASQ